jgi:hypothetical protein
MLKGAYFNTEIGTEHDLLEIIVAADPSQFIMSSEKVTLSNCRIIITYPVIGALPSSGIVHEILTLRSVI